MLSKGYRLQFRRRSLLHDVVHPTVIRNPGQICAFFRWNFCSSYKRAQPTGFCSTYFLVRKQDAGFRPILYVMGQNQYLNHLPFQMLYTRNVMPAIVPISIDLKDAYFLPFGLSLSLHMFTDCVKISLETLQRWGMLVLP